MEGNVTPCICQIYECISCSAPLIYLAAGSVLQPVHTTMLMRGVSGEQSQGTERRGEWSWTRSAMGNGNIQQLSTKGTDRTHIRTHTSKWPAKLYKITERHITTRQPRAYLKHCGRGSQDGDGLRGESL